MKILDLTSSVPVRDLAREKINSPPVQSKQPEKAPDLAPSEENFNRYVEEETAPSNVQQDVEKLNNEMQNLNKSLRFEIDDTTDEVIVTVVDKESDEVIREIPPEEVRRMRERLDEMAGLLLEETV
jgi:flagellar protein FlaG